jgi:formylmethanofuran dehydrogenase subunit B
LSPRAPPPPVARVGGREVALDAAFDAAAEILKSARAPLVHGLGETSCEAQRRAVALAEALGGVVDAGGGGSLAAYQAIGASTATFGEIRDRADLVVIWRADPARSHPRLLERLRVESPIELGTDYDFEALWALRALVTGAPLDRDRVAPLPLDDLARRLLDARHLNRDRHAVTLGLRAGNTRGAEDVLAWQTGFATAVSFARGHPREVFGTEADAALVIGSDVPEHLRDLPVVVVGARAAEGRVAFATAADGIEVAGTAHRMDGVPVPLRAPRDSERPSVEDVLAAIAERL